MLGVIHIKHMIPEIAGLPNERGVVLHRFGARAIAPERLPESAADQSVGLEEAVPRDAARIVFVALLVSGEHLVSDAFAIRNGVRVVGAA